MDVVLTINGRDFSPRLSTYGVQKELVQGRVVTTLDGTEHAAAPKYRDVITFSLWPSDEQSATADFSALSALSFAVSYTSPRERSTAIRDFRLASSLDAAFGIRGVDGNRYYKGGDIVLRAVRCG